MSYSYIRSVFPNFETSHVYDERLYSDLTSSNLTLKDPETKVPIAYEDGEMNRFAKKLLASEKIESQQSGVIEEYQNTPYADQYLKLTAKEPKYPPVNYSPVNYIQSPAKDNLRFYNLPLQQVKQDYQQPVKQEYQETSKKREEFENEKSCDMECDGYVKHILECSKCKAMLTKQLNLEADRVRNEEIMEVISYMIFGVFILLLLDNFKKG